MFKNLLLIILIAILLVYSLGSIAESWLDLQFVIDDDRLDSAQTLVAAVAVGAGLVLLGVLLAASLFGVLVLAGGCVVIALLVAGLSVVWPALLLMILVIWLFKDDKDAQQY
ncbi:hypothetical protein [Bowmanella dokdonensis]|uniref:Uncharacterized protein n=1 Tax=Bowmanella dokdonensis TaxID=751969 RepID=A0A939DT26_9ALTE|nr:hypothetical protein [Bowmanella dokdonensis]MBN7827421.1 hypothetical protein [Bowmanella dokdonensis]